MIRRRGAQEEPFVSHRTPLQGYPKKRRNQWRVFLLVGGAIVLIWRLAGAVFRQDVPHLLDTTDGTCRYYLAESAIPNGGLGLFTAVNLDQGDMAQSMSDVCIYVTRAPKRKTQFQTHSWGQDVFNGIFEGKGPRALCEGFATLFNSMPPKIATSKLTPHSHNTHAGLIRDEFPGAGAITHYYGITSHALRNVSAGAELTIDYGDFTYDENVEYTAPTRSVEYLREHGMCIDNIQIGPSTNPQMGRGAMARRALKRGQLVAPAPLQSYRPSDFDDDQPLLMNYCLVPANTSDLWLFPYGPGVNMINHDSKNPNVEWQWSTHPYHQAAFLNLHLKDYWQVTRPGSLILQVVAIQDIAPGEELFLDYGADWEQAWQKHVAAWKPQAPHVYPQDMDNTLPLLTIKEQETSPNKTGSLMNVCWTNNWERSHEQKMAWTKPTTFEWPEGLIRCHILKHNENDDTYDVALDFDHLSMRPYDNSLPIDTNVPRSAIGWVEAPYTSDMHMPEAFRHPIALPESLSPVAWMD